MNRTGRVRMVVAGALALVVWMAAPAAAAVTHNVAVERTAGGHRITSTVTVGTNAQVQWEFIQRVNPTNDLGKADIQYTTRVRPSVVSAHDVPCPAGEGTWQVHIQVHGGRTGAGKLLFSETKLVQLRCG